MFRDAENTKLYVLDDATSHGSIDYDASYRTLELNPVGVGAKNDLKGAFDETWYGAIVVADSTVRPIYSSTRTGLWVLVEMPPEITVS
jgi:hypothetical protein